MLTALQIKIASRYKKNSNSIIFNRHFVLSKFLMILIDARFSLVQLKAQIELYNELNAIQLTFLQLRQNS